MKFESQPSIADNEHDDEHIEHLLLSLPEELRSRWEENIWGEKAKPMTSKEVISLLEGVIKERENALAETNLKGIEDLDLREKVKAAIAEVERQFEEGSIVLGQGQVGKVVQVPGVNAVCIKFLKDDVQGEKHLKLINNEISILESLRDMVVAGIKVPYLYAYGLDHPPYYFVMETVQGYSLKDIVEKPHEVPDFVERLLAQDEDEVIANLTKYVEELHSRRIVHGDLHAGNIMMDKNGNWFVIDFGTGLVADIGEDISPQDMPYPSNNPSRTFEGAKKAEIEYLGNTIREVFMKAKEHQAKASID